MATQQLSEQEILRRESMVKLRELGIEPYPAPLYTVISDGENGKARLPAVEIRPA